MEVFPNDSPFYGLEIASHEPLNNLKTRYNCEECGKSSRYFCYRCVKLAPSLKVPQVKIPLDLCIVKHVREVDGKSTAIHAKLSSENQVQILTFDPQNIDKLQELKSSLSAEDSVLLYPDDTAQQIPEVDWSSVKRVIVIDGTWQQAKGMIKSSHLQHLVRRVRLDKLNKTLFWRHQKIGLDYLSTIEAIYRFYQELAIHQQGYPSPSLDNLLYFFSFFYNLIQNDYLFNPQRKYTSKHRDDYIQRNNKIT